MILLVLFLFFIAPLDASNLDELSFPSSDSSIKQDDSFFNFFHKIPEEAFYLGLGTAFKAGSFLAHAGESISAISPKNFSSTKEFLLFKNILRSISHHFFTQLSDKSPFKTFDLFSKKIPYSHYSWELNQLELSKIPAVTTEDKELLLFLENRFLAKATGFFPVFIDWLYPCFGISFQIHPETSSSYARSPMVEFSKAYKKRVVDWKKSLPHPESYPLILTRPFDLQAYLPSYLKISPEDSVQKAVQNLALKLEKTTDKVVVDFSSIFSSEHNDQKKWMKAWKLYQRSFIQACKEHKINPTQVIGVQRVQAKTIGGLRLLPLFFFSQKKQELQHQFLVVWLSTFGLSANQIELDRAPSSLCKSNLIKEKKQTPLPSLSKEDFLEYLTSYDQKWGAKSPQKTLLLNGILFSLKGLFNNLSKDKWEEISSSPIRLSVTELSFFKIKEQLEILYQKEESTSFFNAASYMEQIYSNLSTLIEIFSPFTFDDFPLIHNKLLKSIPQDLKSWTSHTLHSSAMTSLAGIFQAAKQTLGRAPHILYGENSYHECINACNFTSKASKAEDVQDKDLKDVDVFLSQFHPVWKPFGDKTEYKTEQVANSLRKVLHAKKGNPLTLALDCTFDYINSSQVGQILQEFEPDIKSGALNVICFHSGLKFDLLGMDNYCGSPFYMIHNKDPKWSFFDALIDDPVLKTDLLSLNWFCLAYQNIAPQLEQYRKQIFDNTKELLSKLPPSLFNEKNTYRVTPVSQDANVAYIDITVKGPFHRAKLEALVAGYFTLKCLENNSPLFYRISIGLYHTNLTKLSEKNSSSARLTLGLDPEQIDMLAECLKNINELNSSEVI